MKFIECICPPAALLLAMTLIPSLGVADEWVLDGDPQGKLGKTCKSLLDRLNAFQRDNSTCVSDAIESYPAFVEPPWERIDAKEHFELVVKLERYAQEGARAFFQGPQKNSDETYRYRAILALGESSVPVVTLFHFETARLLVSSSP